jgi:hypothetical protein
VGSLTNNYLSAPVTSNDETRWTFG